MTNLNENSVEQFTINLLKSLGWDYVFGPDIAPDTEITGIQINKRESYSDVLLYDVLERALERINPDVPKTAIGDAIKQLTRINGPDLIANNEVFHRLLTEGVKVSYRKNGEERGDIVWLVDFNNPDNNEFIAINQFTVVENGVNKRPDIVLFINGIPIVVIELKNPSDESATLMSAFRQIQTYKTTIPSLFVYNEILIISNGLEAKAGSLSAGWDRFMAWKSSDGETESSPLVNQLETLVKGLLNKETLLDFIQFFIVFNKTSYEDKKTKQITIRTTKKIAAYHQYYAVNKAVRETLRASDINSGNDMVREKPELYGLKSTAGQPPGDRKAGVIWHTQGSGKSLSMVFYTAEIIQMMDNPTIVVITDRNDLDDQLYDTFVSSKNLLRQTPVQASTRKELKELLKVGSGGIVFTTIHKFYPEEGNVYDMLSDRSNIVVIADEAHRTQYGFRGRVDKNTGEIKYGFAKYMRDALPNATYIGFTGTPIEKDDRNTPAVFGNYIDIYDISKSVEDKMTVPIYYESRLVKVGITEEGKRLINELDAELKEMDEFYAQRTRSKWARLEALIGSKDRIRKIAEDIVSHFEERLSVFDGKGMIVTMSRRIAVDLYEEIIKIRPEWHSDDLDEGFIKVVMTASSSDGPKMAKYHTTKEQRRRLADRMKDPESNLKLVIVVDMWLTGFDVPSLHTMYIDKPMKGHTLMQAIARVNRVYKDKPAGLIVDYLGIAADLKAALAFYADSGGKGDPARAQEEAVVVVKEKIEVVRQMFHNFDYKRYFSASTPDKLNIILEAEERILGLENGRKRYVKEVTALSKAYAIATPHDDVKEFKEEIAFFQAVKARLVKLETPTRKSDGMSVDMETTIKQIIDRSLVSSEVVDVFDAAGLKKPNIDVLSEEFLLEVKNMKHRNIAIEVLKKILNDEIKGRFRRNVVQSRSLMEMLENSIKRYHNKVITAAQFIEELIEMANEIKKASKAPEEMGLTEHEYAFYMAVANNKSAIELMGKDKLRELAVVLYQKVRENASIDWTIRESVRAKLRVIVKRTLRKYGYPPDMEKLATDIVLEQAEQIAEELLM